MANDKLTPRMSYPYPSEGEQPFFTVYQAGEFARDASHYAHSENHNFVLAGGGTFSWDAGTSTLSWTDPIFILGFATNNFLTIDAQSVVIEDGQVVFFNVLRLLKTNPTIPLEIGSRIEKSGVRLHDLMLFAARVGDTIYFPFGKSMQDGDAGTLYGGGLAGGGGGGITLLSEGDGIDIVNPAGPTATISAEFAGSGGAFGTATTVARSDHSHPALGHDHEVELFLAPGAGVTSLNVNADGAISAKTLLDAQLYRNGQRLAQGALRDYTVNIGPKTISLNFTTVAADSFVIDRRAI